MEYTVQKLAKLAGVTGRTLRYYDEIGLLKPARINASGYRVYEGPQVDALQQILFYRELGFPLPDIARAMSGGDRLAALRGQLRSLEAKRERLGELIGTLRKTIQAEEGGVPMEDGEKFEGLKRALIDENERTYGPEIRAKYGEAAVAESNARMMNLTREQYERMQSLGAEIQERLEAAVREGLPAEGQAGRDIALLHKRWLAFTWAQYTPQAHRALGQLYLDDPRFTAHYDSKVPGCARFLRDAIHAFAGELA